MESQPRGYSLHLSPNWLTRCCVFSYNFFWLAFLKGNVWLYKNNFPVKERGWNIGATPGTKYHNRHFHITPEMGEVVLSLGASAWGVLSSWEPAPGFFSYSEANVKTEYRTDLSETQMVSLKSLLSESPKDFFNQVLVGWYMKYQNERFSIYWFRYQCLQFKHWCLINKTDF